MSKRIRTYRELSGEDRSGIVAQVVAQQDRVRERLSAVRHTVAVMSGKGGVGKSFVTALLATALAEAGKRVGVLDADLHGPTAARMLGVRSEPLVVRDDDVVPPEGARGVRVMSSDLLLAEGAPLKWKEPGEARFVWRGTLEAGMLREFLGDVAWGELDLLLVDLPPGTDCLTTLMELLPGLTGVLAVTIPSDASLRAVARSLQLAREGGIRILGIVENMASYRCAQCGAQGPLMSGDAADRLATLAGAPVLARLPFDPAVQAAVDVGRLGEPADPAFAALAAALLARVEGA